MMNLNISGLLFSAIFILFQNAASAGVQISNTRIIYPGVVDEVQATVKNTGNGNQLVQAWVDNFDKNDKSKPPLIITPPLFKLIGGQTNILHFISVDKNGILAKDREQIFWANIKSIEATPKVLVQQSKLQLATRSRIKLIWRPKGLNKSDAQEAYKSLIFSVSGGRLAVDNPTAYYISLHNMTVDGKEVKPPKDTLSAVSMMISPYSKMIYSLPGGNAKSVRWSAIDDYGNATSEQEKSL